MSVHFLCSQLLLIATFASADFIFDFQIVRHATNGNCFGFDFTIPCETFVNDFCLRGPSFQGMPRDTDRGRCPLGKNTERVFTSVPADRSIRSSQPWPGSFQLYIGAHDDDYPLTSFDFLDNIFVDRFRNVGNSYSTEERVWGDHDKVAVDIRYRVRCVSNYYDTACSQYCLARDDSSGHYTCDPNDGSIVCLAGYEHPETNCVDRITACSRSPCDRGSCSPIGLTEFTCTCPPGYTGQVCDQEIDECLNNTVCLNEGNCTDLLADFSCDCVPGFTGETCDIDINECLKVNCTGNATCVHGIDQYECICNPGFQGPNCTEIDPCDVTPCAATGVCVSYSPFEYSCVCEGGYTGFSCDLDIDDCLGVSCPVNSECVDELNNYHCECHIGFTGPNCTDNIAVVEVGAPSSATATVGGAVGGIMVVILLLLVIIVCIVLFITLVRRRSKRQFTVPENAYEVSPTPESPGVNFTNSLYSPTGDPLINNPLYTLSSTSMSPEHTNSDFTMSTSPAYSRVREINNPLYGETSPARAAPPDPVYAELEGPSHSPQKGSINYPYSYAGLHQRPTSDVTTVPLPTTPPHSEHQGPQYEVVQPKPSVTMRTESAVAVHGYDVPKSVTSPPPSPYEVPTAANNKLGGSLPKESVAKKMSIYDSDDDHVPNKPVPKPRPSQFSDNAYSYAMIDGARGGSVKIKEDGGGGGEVPPTTSWSMT